MRILFSLLSMAKAGRHISQWQRYFIIVQLKYTRGQRHRPGIVLMHSISGPMRCISSCTLIPGVNLQLPPSCNLFDRHIWRFLPAKWHLPGRIIFAPGCNFRNPTWFKSSLVYQFWARCFSIHIPVGPGPFGKCQQSPPTCCPDPKSEAAEYTPSFPQMCTCLTHSIEHASDLTCVDSGQLATPRELGTFVWDGQKYILSKYSKCVLRKFTRASLRTVY